MICLNARSILSLSKIECTIIAPGVLYNMLFSPDIFESNKFFVEQKIEDICYPCFAHEQLNYERRHMKSYPLLACKLPLHY